MKPHLNLSLNIVMNAVRVETCHPTSNFHIHILSAVSFLELKVTIEKDGSLTTSLFSKPSATFQYLNAKLNHLPHTIKALPKSQFISICRICSYTTDYWKHATDFIKFFTKRGYKPAT